MPKSSEETADLLATVEEIRASKYPTLDQLLVRDILSIHHRYAEDPAEAHKQTEMLLNRWATAQLGSEAR